MDNEKRSVDTHERGLWSRLRPRMPASTRTDAHEDTHAKWTMGMLNDPLTNEVPGQ